jgi:hypothetical protein
MNREVRSMEKSGLNRTQMVELKAECVDKATGLYACPAFSYIWHSPEAAPDDLVQVAVIVDVNPVVLGGVGVDLTPTDAASELVLIDAVANARKVALDKLKMTNAEYLCLSKRIWEGYFHGESLSLEDGRFFGMYPRCAEAGVSLPKGAQFMIIDRPMGQGGH